MAVIGNKPATNFQSIKKQTITGTGDSSYSLDYAVSNANDLEVFVNNVRQEPTIAYNATSQTITFSEGIDSTDDVYMIYQGQTMGSVVHPADQALSATNITASGTLDVTGAATFTKNPFKGTGGTETTYSSGGVDYKVHTFLSSGTFTATGATQADILVVGGGGGGGNAFNNDACGGGGGAGAVIAIEDFMLAGGTYTITVGLGGAGGVGADGDASSGGSRTTASSSDGQIGGNSSAFGIQADGGGGGSTYPDCVAFSNGNGSGGGNGGAGGKLNNSGSTRSSTDQTFKYRKDDVYGYSGGLHAGTGQSNNTASSGGGGGAGDQGSDGTNGGAGANGGVGVQNNFRTGSNVYYGGGGAGGSGGTTGGGTGGSGGGGNGGASNTAGGNGTANTGGGGGGASADTPSSGVDGGDGGSGIIVIRYRV
jgi:hypothetical protein